MNNWNYNSELCTKQYLHVSIYRANCLMYNCISYWKPESTPYYYHLPDDRSDNILSW